MLNRLGFFVRPKQPASERPPSSARDNGVHVSPQPARVEVLLTHPPSSRGNVDSRTASHTPQENKENESDGIPTVTSDLSRQRKRRGPIPFYGVPESFMDFEISIDSGPPQNTPACPAAASPVDGDVTPRLNGDGSAPPVKRRGRPKGWKPGMPYSATTKRPTSEATKQIHAEHLKTNPPDPNRPKGRVGRPPKKPAQTPREIFLSLTPTYTPFICEWKGCKAELQNMETLRKHVHKIHGRDDTCGWRTCGWPPRRGAGDPHYYYSDEEKDPEPLHPPPTFQTDAEMATHIEKAHLVPFAWHMGDGFLNRGFNSSSSVHTRKRKRRGDDNDAAEEEREGGKKGGRDAKAEVEDDDDDNDKPPTYCFDKNGNQVTPWVLRDQRIEDQATRLANRKRLRAVLAQIYADAPSEEESPAEEPEAP